MDGARTEGTVGRRVSIRMDRHRDAWDGDWERGSDRDSVWMDAKIDKGMLGDGQTDGQMDPCGDGWMHGCTMDGSLCKWMDGEMDGWLWRCLAMGAAEWLGPGTR